MSKDKSQRELDFDSDANEDADAIDGDGSPLAGERGPLKEMIDSNFLRYASYVICERAIPALSDGLKPVQRRILHALYEKDDGRFTKVANIVGHAMQYHPHGDTSITDALVALVNKGYLIEGQGNFGNLFTGDAAAASRYIECRLTPMAREEVFNRDLTKMIPSYDARTEEPVSLPSKLPLLLMLGAEGIAVGLATRILPHNFIELLEAQVAVIKKKPFSVLPDFAQGGMMDATDYRSGQGSVRVRATIKKRGADRLVVTQLPYGTTTETLISSIEDAARRKKVKVSSINDFTSEQVEIELILVPESDPDRAIQALYAFTSCEVTISSNIVVIRKGKPVKMTVDDVVRANAKRLLKLLRNELNHEKNKLLDEFHTRTLTRIFIEERIYKQIEKCKTQDAVVDAVMKGVASFRSELTRDVTRKDVDMLLALRIRRISLFDINKNRKDIEKILADLETIEKNLANLSGYACRTLNRLIKKYAEDYPRRTQVTTFGTVEVKKLTASELSISYDKDGGYVGHNVKGKELLQCSSYHKLILIWSDGRYRVVNPPDKLFADKDLIYCAVADRDRDMTVIYTHEGLTYIKRFKVGGTILNKDYTCALPDSEVLLLQEGAPEEVYVKYKPAKGQRIHQQVFTPAEVSVKGARARGNLMTSKDIDKITTKKPRWWKKEKSHRGVLLH